MQIVTWYLHLSLSLIFKIKKFMVLSWFCCSGYYMIGVMNIHQEIEKLSKSNIRKDWKGYYCWYYSWKRPQRFIWWDPHGIWFGDDGTHLWRKEKDWARMKEIIGGGMFPSLQNHQNFNHTIHYRGLSNVR